MRLASSRVPSTTGLGSLPSGTGNGVSDCAFGSNAREEALLLLAASSPQARNYPRPQFEYQTPKKIEIPGSVLKCSRAAAHTAAQPRVSKKRFWASQTEPVLKKEPRAPTPIVSVFFAGPKGALFLRNMQIARAQIRINININTNTIIAHTHSQK